MFSQATWYLEYSQTDLHQMHCFGASDLKLFTGTTVRNMYNNRLSIHKYIKKKINILQINNYPGNYIFVVSIAYYYIRCCSQSTQRIQEPIVFMHCCCQNPVYFWLLHFSNLSYSTLPLICKVFQCISNKCHL